MENNNDLKVSSYNSAELKNILLHKLWEKSQDNAIAGIYDKWNVYLDMIFGELVGDIEKSSTENKEYNSFVTRLNKTGSLKLSNPVGFNTQVKNNRDEQYTILLEKHIWLKRLQNKLNRGTRFKDEFEDDFE